MDDERWDRAPACGPGGGAQTVGNLGQGGSSGAYIDWSAVVRQGGPFWVFGMAAPDVARIRIELDSGPPVVVPAVGHELDFPVGFYVADLPPGARPIAIVALDQDDQELERLDASISMDIGT